MNLRLALLLCSLVAACDQGAPQPALPTTPPIQTLGSCAPNSAPLELTGSAASTDAKTYRILPFEVKPGTGRVEVSYRWTDKAGPPSTPLTATTLDLGLYDEKGYRNPSGFRGWGGSRQGRIDKMQAPVFVQADSADRGFSPGVVNPGAWFVELGIAAVSPQGADWLVKIECKTAGGATPAEDPVDKTHVARFTPGWYHGDFHMHAFHSNPNAPIWDDFIAMARTAKLDFLMVTEYVTGRHWETLGAVQRAHPDLLIWPGREIITYFGHVTTHGETPGLHEYRHGFEDVNIGEIQREAKRENALFQVNHPTTFPPPVFSNLCRGCYFELGDQIDWAQVDTLEIMNGPVLTTSEDIGSPVPIPGTLENPFLQTALKLWDDQLNKGYKLTGVSGSDSKGVEPNDGERQRRGYGCSATAVYADNLSRAALTAALKAGHAYVQTRGVDRSPVLEFVADTADGQHGMFGDTLTVANGAQVALTTTVSGGANQLLIYIANGVPIAAVPITTDPFVNSFPLAMRLPNEGPLGTFWRVEVRDAMSRTVIGNPIFLKGG